jgi:hypothetical protein
MFYRSNKKDIIVYSKSISSGDWTRRNWKQRVQSPKFYGFIDFSLVEAQIETEKTKLKKKLNVA